VTKPRKNVIALTSAGLRFTATPASALMSGSNDAGAFTTTISS
jgi:hypothetical protein